MEKQTFNPVTGWWENQPRPRGVTILIACAYVATTIAGLSVVLNLPTFLSYGLGGDPLTIAWGWLLTLGGAAGFASIPGGLYWLERIALAMTGLALILYFVVMMELQRYLAANVTYQAWLTLVLLFHIGIRFARVWHGMRDPEKLDTGKIRRADAA